MGEDRRVLAARLLDPARRFAPAGVRQRDGAGEPGLYAWYVDEGGARDLTDGLGLAVVPGLLYAGQAGAGASGATLASRVLGNHIGGNTYASTLRLTLAAVLIDRLDLVPTGGRRMEARGEAALSGWMTAHLQLSIEAFPDRGALDTVETKVLAILDPPFNLAKCRPTPVRRRLNQLRRAFTGPHSTAAPARHQVVPGRSTAARESAGAPTPEELARELGLPDAKRVRAFLRQRFPRLESESRSRWGPLSPEMEAAVRQQFGSDR